MDAISSWAVDLTPLATRRKTAASGPNLFLLTVGLAYWNSLTSRPGVAQVLYILVVTGSVVAISPVMIVFLFLQRYWQGGLSLGSIKE